MAVTDSLKQDLVKDDYHEAPLPPLIKANMTANEVAGFDSFKSSVARPASLSIFGIEAASTERMHHLSISMPASPVEIHLQKRVFFSKDDQKQENGAHPASTPTKNNVGAEAKLDEFHSQPMHNDQPLTPVNHDKRFDPFKTWSGRLERQLSALRGESQQETQTQTQPTPELKILPVHCYYDALEGPELDTLRASEEILLPKDKKWPFLLRFPISTFGVCLGVSSQAILWKRILNSPVTAFLGISRHRHINLVLWCISAALTMIVTIVYTLKVIFYFEAVRREYYHPVRVNFFFAPWITLLFLAMGVPPLVAPLLQPYMWYILMAPILCLELKIYGQWMAGGQRRLSKVANPSNHLAVVGNFVGALLGASLGLQEGPIFFFAVGVAHYTVLFVTLYQRLPTNETLPKELHPVFFLFVAAPSVASMAWAKIDGSFDHTSHIAYFIAMFLYVSLAVRINFFRGFKFSLSWWAYTFPMTSAALATIQYSSAVPSRATPIMAVALCLVATVAVAVLLVTTIVHAVVLGDLFPNDMAIAISERRTRRRWYHKRRGSSDTNIERYLKYSDPNRNDIESSLHSTPSNASSQD